jgi:hypothetical protein
MRLKTQVTVTMRELDRLKVIQAVVDREWRAARAGRPGPAATVQQTRAANLLKSAIAGPRKSPARTLRFGSWVSFNPRRKIDSGSGFPGRSRNGMFASSMRERRNVHTVGSAGTCAYNTGRTGRWLVRSVCSG